MFVFAFSQWATTASFRIGKATVCSQTMFAYFGWVFSGANMYICARLIKRSHPATLVSFHTLEWRCVRIRKSRPKHLHML